MMKKNRFVFLDVLLFLGLFLFFTAFILSIVIGFINPNFFIRLLPFVYSSIGILCGLFSIFVTKKAYHFFIGFSLFLWGVIELLLNHNVIPFSFSQYWPLYAVVISLVSFSTGLFKYKAIKFGYLIPSLAFFLLGIFLCLFSFKIVSVPFRDAMLIIIPLLLFLGCIFVISLCAFQQKYKKLIIQSDSDNSDNFDDDDISVENGE